MLLSWKRKWSRSAYHDKISHKLPNLSLRRGTASIVGDYSHERILCIFSLLTIAVIGTLVLIVTFILRTEYVKYYDHDDDPDVFKIKRNSLKSKYDKYTDGTYAPIVTSEMIDDSDRFSELRKTEVKAAMKHVWNNYKKFAMGADEILPLHGIPHNFVHMSITLLDSLDTLWLMDMKQEFYEARDWIEKNLTFEFEEDSIIGQIRTSVFELIIRAVGGLLSAYDLSNEKVFLNKALILTKGLCCAAFDDTFTFPSPTVQLRNLATCKSNHKKVLTSLADVGTMLIEFKYLSRVTGISKFEDYALRILHELKRFHPKDGLFPTTLLEYKSNTKKKERVSALSFFTNHKKRYPKKTRENPDKEVDDWIHDKEKSQRKSSMNAKKDEDDRNNSKNKFNATGYLTFGALGDSFYEYLLKGWIFSGMEDNTSREMYDNAIQGLHDRLLYLSSPSHLSYITSIDSTGKITHEMDHLTCFMGGLLAIGAYTDPLGLSSARAQRDLKSGKALTYTCYQMYSRMETGLSPEVVRFLPDDPLIDFAVDKKNNKFILRPEVVESLYIMNQLTGDPVYLEWGWEIFQAITLHCKTRFGFAEAKWITKKSTLLLNNHMESFFLAETLKYMYLMFDKDSIIDVLSTHVFNTEAHPLRRIFKF